MQNTVRSTLSLSLQFPLKHPPGGDPAWAQTHPVRTPLTRASSSSQGGWGRERALRKGCVSPLSSPPTQSADRQTHWKAGRLSVCSWADPLSRILPPPPATPPHAHTQCAEKNTDLSEMIFSSDKVRQVPLRRVPGAPLSLPMTCSHPDPRSPGRSPGHSRTNS